jgi:hypothetical protein
MAFRKKTEPKRSRTRLLLAALLVPVVAGIAWAVRNFRPSAAGDEMATADDTDAATGAPAAAAPGQSSVGGNGNASSKVSATS